MARESSSSSGVGVGFVLFVVFLVLKLTHVINWSWWWITAPLWGGAALILGVFAVALLVGGVAVLGKKAGRR